MRSRNNVRPGISLIEIIVVIAILAALAAIMQPVYVGVRKRASETVCISNLRQFAIAMQMYRDRYDGSDSGSASQMGLPHHASLLNVAVGSQLRCRGVFFRDQSKPGAYAFHWPQKINADLDPIMETEWKLYLEASQGNPVFAADYNHQYSYPLSEYSLVRGRGATLQGSIVSRKNYGIPNLYRWWYIDY